MDLSPFWFFFFDDSPYVECVDHLVGTGRSSFTVRFKDFWNLLVDNGITILENTNYRIQNLEHRSVNFLASSQIASNF